jgi:hypothetical protein
MTRVLTVLAKPGLRAPLDKRNESSSSNTDSTSEALAIFTTTRAYGQHDHSHGFTGGVLYEASALCRD